MADIKLYSGETAERFAQDQIDMLNAPLDAQLIKERKSGGGMVKYLKVKTVQDAANRIFGYGRWGYRILSRGRETCKDEAKGREIEFYTCDIELWVAGSLYTFPGDGVGIVTSPYTVEMHEKARKEAASDAIKRALRHYGDQFGLALYDEDSVVDMGDGTPARVGDVRVSQAGPNTLKSGRVIDAAPARAQQSARSEQAEPIDEAPATEAQLTSMRKLYEHLGLPMPKRSLTYAQARTAIKKLADAWREKQDAAAVPLDQVSAEMAAQKAGAV